MNRDHSVVFEIMTNPDRVLETRDITLATKAHIVKAMAFPVVMYGCESWTIKKVWRINTFKLWCWRRLLRVPWTSRRSKQSILKDINLKYSLEGLVLKLELQHFNHLMQSWHIGKDDDAGKDWRQEDKGMTKDEIVGWHHQLNGCEFEQTQRWWRTGKPTVLQSMGFQRVRHNLETEQQQQKLK